MDLPVYLANGLLWLLYTLFGFLLMLYLMLPSATAEIQRAARTSDVL